MNRKNSAELKLQARQVLLGKYGIVIGAMLIFWVLIMLISAVIQFVTMFMTLGGAMMSSVTENPYIGLGTIIASMFSSFLLVAAEYMIIPGYMKLHLNICTGQPYEIGDLFFVFKNHPTKFLLLGIAMWAVTMASMIPFFGMMALAAIFESFVMIILSIIVAIACYVGLIILMLNLSMVFFIMADRPETGVINCLKESCRIMKGNKGRLFCLGLSFIGIVILSMMSFGIGYLWTAPYICSTTTYFYLEIREPEKEDIVWTSGGEENYQAGSYDYQNPV